MTTEERGFESEHGGERRFHGGKRRMLCRPAGAVSSRCSYHPAPSGRYISGLRREPED
jgi:hypothetical protein